MKKFFLHNGADAQGPFDIEELKTKNLTKQTPIWYEGLDEWTTAGKVEELKAIFASVSPPNFKPLAVQPQTYYEPAKPKSNGGKYTLIIILLLALGGGGLYLANQNSSGGRTGSYETSTETYQEKVMTIEEIEKSQPTKFLTADGNYNENFWGNKLKVHGTITNKATVATYKDAVVRVTYYSKTNTELRSQEYTIYKEFSPHTATRFKLKIKNDKEVNAMG